MDSIYLDYNATSPVLPEAREAMRPWLESDFGNPSSTHRLGQKARDAVEGAREAVAALLHADPREILFTSGGTESDNLAVLGVLRASGRGRHALASAVEHHAVLNTVHALPGLGFSGSFLPVDRGGRVDPSLLEESLGPDTALVSVMHANNETGALQDVERVGEACRRRRVPYHCDAVQTFGKLPLDLKRLPVDLLSASAHKFGGPKGAGFLFVRRGLRLVPLLHGGEQENEVRPGTENVAGIVGMAAAAAAACARMGAEAERQRALRDRLEAALRQGVPGLRVNASGGPRVDNTLSVLFPGVESDVMIMKLDAMGLCVSSGSACAAGASQPSHVLKAMGLGEAESQTVIRLSLGPGTTREQVDFACQALPRAWQELCRAGVG